MEFRNAFDNKDLIHSEGPILSLVENVDDYEMTNERLYLKGTCLQGNYHIYTRVNDTSLEMFFQGRLSVKELFLLRKDEDFLMENAQDRTQELVFCNEEFENRVIGTIECGNYHYYSISKGMRLEDPFTEILHFVKRDYTNGIGAISADRTNGNNWIDRHV